MVIHGEQEGLLGRVRPPLVNGRIVLPQFAEVRAFPPPPGFRMGLGLGDEVGKAVAGKGSNGLAMAFETQAGGQFIGHKLKIGRLLQGQELLEETDGWRRPGGPMVAPGRLGGEPGACPEEASAEPVKMGAADLQVVGRICGVNLTLIELPKDLLEKQVGQALGDLLFLIAPSQSNRRPLVEGFRRPSLRSGLLNPSTKGRSPTPDYLSPFELPPVSFCSRPDSKSRLLVFMAFF